MEMDQKISYWDEQDMVVQSSKEGLGSLVTPRNQTRQRCKRMLSFMSVDLHRTPWCTYDWIKRCHMDTGRGRASITCFPWVLKETSMVMENKGGGDLKDLNKWWLHGHQPSGKGEGIWQQSQRYKSLEQRRRRILLICSIYLSSRSDAVDQNSFLGDFLHQGSWLVPQRCKRMRSSRLREWKLMRSCTWNMKSNRNIPKVMCCGSFLLDLMIDWLIHQYPERDSYDGAQGSLMLLGLHILTKSEQYILEEHYVTKSIQKAPPLHPPIYTSDMDSANKSLPA